jgi:predicted nuclease of predicted toxin-antitoxin system
MNLLIDMNLPPGLAKILTDMGLNSIHWYAIGPPNASDQEIMAYARDSNYIVVTHDLDFGAILSATHGKKPSVVQIRTKKIKADEIAAMLHAALLESESELKEGAILTIDVKKARLRLLPLVKNEE